MRQIEREYSNFTARRAGLLLGLVTGVICSSSAMGQQRLSPYTTTTFVPNGTINEFINIGGNSQEYFITDPLLENPLDPEFGAIKAAAILTRGVCVRRDNSPLPGTGEAGPTGHRDTPAVLDGQNVPTGFNIGRVFASYNPDAFGGEGAYFLAMDISAPAELDSRLGTQPIAFDVDGDGSRTTVNDAPNLVSEVPTDEDVYRFIIDTNNDGISDVRITIGERAGSIPFGAVAIGAPQLIQNLQGQNVSVQRWVFFEWLAGAAPGTPPDLARLFLDANNDGSITEADFGVGADVEIVVRNVKFLPHFPDAPPHPAVDGTPECVRITFIADTFDDEPLGGGAEDLVVLECGFAVPDLEVTKEVKCVDESDDAYRDRANATPGSVVQYRITVQNWGNRDLNVTLSDILTATAPATASVVPGSCQVTADPGAPFNSGAFCAAFHAGIADGSLTDLPVGLLEADDECASGLGEQLVFTFRVTTGPETPNTALCDQGIDIVNAVSATGSVVEILEGILAPAPAAPDDPVESNAEEEDCSDAACCAGVPACGGGEICSGAICVTVGCPAGACVPNDGIGDVRDEFTATVSDDANVIDTRREVEAAADDNVAEVELECRNITFLKQVRRQGDANFKTGTDALNLPGDAGSYPLVVEFKYTITNSGENPETFTLNDSGLCSDIAAAAGVDFVVGQCALCTPPTPGELSGTVNPGVPFTSSCNVTFADLASVTAFMGVDDGRPACRAESGGAADPLCYRNCATVDSGSGTTQVPVCDDGSSFDSFATTCVVRECQLEVSKTIQCLDSCTNGNPIGAPSDSLMTVPGACAQFTITVRNTGPVAVPLVCIDDDLTCTWTTSGLVADINGDNVTADLVAAGFGPNSGRDCITFPSHPGGLGVAEVLTIKLNIQIPVNFAGVSQAVDCRNSVEVDGYRSTNANTNEPPDTLCTGEDEVTIDVKVPGINCGKTVAVDLGNDGSIDIPATTSAVITNVAYPIRLVYSLSVRNTGELPISNAQVCDDRLVADALAAGATVGPCDLCNAACDGVGDTCANVGDLAVGSPAAVRTCTIILDSQAEFDEFAGRDDQLNGRSDCYTNTMRSRGDITPPCSPPGFPTTVSSGNCTATVCIAFVPGCPITKAKFDIWNQNERRFSGTERCITSWDQRLLSAYTVNSIANQFTRRALQTDKAKARIDGMASTVVCGEESVSAPLIGLAAKVLTFAPNREVEMAGMSLVGTGTEAGNIKYDIFDGAAGPPPGPAIPDPKARSGITQKGSLIVYPKVEIKWNAQFELIQDTFLDITNDYADYIRVQFYFVNGDSPLAARLDQAGNEIERAHPGCNAVDVELVLTPDQPMHWSALTGDGGSALYPANMSPFTILDPGFPPGRPDDDPRNPGGRVLRGYVLAWAVDVDLREIRYNHLAGDAIIINYPDSIAWEYNTWNFPAVAGVNNHDLLLTPYGQLNLDGIEYAFAPDRLNMDFYTSGTILRSGGNAVAVDTDLTLWAVSKDLRRP